MTRGKLIVAGLVVFAVVAAVWAMGVPSRLNQALTGQIRAEAERKVQEAERQLGQQDKALRDADQKLTAERQRLQAAIAAKDRQIMAKDQEISTLHTKTTAEATRRKQAEERLQAALALTRTPEAIHEALRLMGHPHP